jgi:hypothetical protein
MLPRINGVGLPPVPPVDPVNPAARGADPRQEAFQRSLGTMLGSELRATVLSRLHDGSFLVRVADTQVRMMLPPGAKAGAELPMTVLAAFPQPTFHLSGAALPAAMAAWRGTAHALSPSATLLGTAPMTPAAMLPQLSADSPAAALSPAARLLADVINMAHSRPGAPTALVAAAPLVRGPVADPAQLAQQLQGAISQSGLFYESHIAQWAEGQRSRADLNAEPQMQQRPGSPLSDPATAQFVNLQLTSQEHGHVAWHGQLGAGQALEWQIDKDAPEAQHDEGTDAEPGWRSGLRLRFALLGEIEASISLRGDQLHIDLRPATDAAGELLRGHAAQLGAALEAAGTPLSSLRIGSQVDNNDD